MRRNGDWERALPQPRRDGGDARGARNSPRTAFTTHERRPCVSQCSNAARICPRWEARICARDAGPTERQAVSVTHVSILNFLD